MLNKSNFDFIIYIKRGTRFCDEPKIKPFYCANSCPKIHQPISRTNVSLIEGITKADDELVEIGAFFINKELPVQFKDAKGNRDPTKIRNDMAKFKEFVMEEMLTQIPDVVESIAPMQAIAKGMKSFCAENNLNFMWGTKIKPLMLKHLVLRYRDL